jgi:hypothetical protein
LSGAGHCGSHDRPALGLLRMTDRDVYQLQQIELEQIANQVMA